MQRIGIFILLLAAAAVSAEQRRPAARGSSAVAYRNYDIPTLYHDFPGARVVFPSDILSSQNQTYPLLVFSHGKYAGGNRLILARSLMDFVASHGFIVAAHRSCDIVCDRYYMEPLKMIEWAQSMKEDPIMSHVNHEVGYGLYGFSMGGRATAEALRYADNLNIKAGLLLHPGSFSQVIGQLNISVPMAAFTGSRDSCCGEENTRRYFDLAPPPKVFASINGANHYQPLYRFFLHPYIAAWFKIFLQDDKGSYYNLFYGDGLSSICGGGLPLHQCEIVDTVHTQVAFP